MKEIIESKEPEIKHLPSIVDQLVKLEQDGSNTEGLTRKEKRWSHIRNKRIEQAKELAKNVFLPDFKDRIYQLVDISESELRRIEFIHRILHARADLSSFEQILALMPGGENEVLEEEEEKEANKLEFAEYGGKMKVEIMTDIVEILNENREYDMDELHELQKLRRSNLLSSEQAIELGEICLGVMRTLVFRHNIPISRLT
jgi:hypothetical protein